MPPVLLVDLTHLDYIDSAGIAALYHAMEGLAPDGWLGLLNPSPTTVRLLTIAGLTAHRACRVFLDREEAEQALQGREP